jgi:hypothetical protein
MSSKIFENEHRVRADDCAVNAKDYQNASISDYTLWNNYMMKCNKDGDKKLEEFSTSHNNLHFKNGYGFTTACEVDNDTEVRLNGKLTNERAKTQFFIRPFVAVPDLSRGLVAPNLETRLKEGDDTTQLRECFRLTETDFNRFTPLLPCLKDNIQNPSHIISPWVWGGDDSRQLMRNSKVLNKCGFQNNGKYWERK